MNIPIYVDKSIDPITILPSNFEVGRPRPEDLAAGGRGPGRDSGTEPRHRNAAGEESLLMLVMLVGQYGNNKETIRKKLYHDR